MTTPKQLADAVKAFAARAANGSIFETTESVHISGSFDATFAEQIPELSIAATGLEVAISVEDAIGTEINALDVANHVGEPGGLVLRKHPTDSTFYFLTADGFSQFFQSNGAEAARRILVAESTASFTTFSCEFGPWEGRIDDIETPDPLDLVSPKRYVRDLANRCPRKIGSDILKAEPEQPDSVFAAWKRDALPRLRDSLVSEVWPDDEVVLRGDRSIVAAGALPLDDDALFSLATESARWVYAEGSDVEVRHILFTHELARLWPDGVDWAEGMRRYADAALESAGNAYRQHLSETTNETLKALSDLRKTLNDEVSKINQQTKDNVGALWRDFAIAFAAIVAHFAVEKQPHIDPIYSRALLWVAAAYLAVVVLSTLWSNNQFAGIAKASQANWRRRLYGFLSDADYTELTTKPLEKAGSVFAVVSWVVGIVYFLTIGGLLYVSNSQIGLAATTTTSPTPLPTPPSNVTPHPTTTTMKCHGRFVVIKLHQPCP